MTSVRKFFTPWKALIAVVAIFAATTPSRADLYVQISDGTKTNGYDVTKSPSQTVSFDGYSYSFTVSAPKSPGSQALVLDATVTDVSATKAANISLLVYSDAQVGITSRGFFSPIAGAGSSPTLSNSLQVLSNQGGASVSSVGTYSAYHPFTLSGPEEVTSSSKSFVASANTGYDLTGKAGITGLGTPGGSVTLTETTKIALPEPSGIVAAMAGLPCMGLLLGFVRRRRALADAAAAV